MHNGKRVQSRPLVRSPLGEGEVADSAALESGWSARDQVAIGPLWRDAYARKWVAAVVATSIAGFGLLLVNPNQNGPMSAHNRQRLHRISILQGNEDAASGSASGAIQWPLGRRPRIFCAMMHIEQSPYVRAGYKLAVEETWGRHCDGLLLWDERRADIELLDIEASKDEPETDSPPSDRWLRARRMWRHIHKHALPHFDWFIAVDDGGFVFPENLLRVIHAIENDGEGQEPGSPHVLVHTGNWAAWGYVLNAAAVQEFIAAIDNTGDGARDGCPIPSAHGSARLAEEYSTVLRCLQEARGIKATQWDDHPAVRQALGCTEGEHTIVNLKSRDQGPLCQHAVLAYMVPTPSWMREISDAVYGVKS